MKADELAKLHLQANDADRKLDELRAGGDTMLLALARIMLDREAAIDTEGWDQPPRLYGLHRRFEGKGMFVAMVEIPFADVGHGEISDYLEYLYKKMRKSDIRFNDLFGYMFITEAWMGGRELPDSEIDDIEGWAERNYQFGEVRNDPERLEIRDTCTVDTAGNTIEIHRIRGMPGRALMVAGENYKTVGRIPAILHEIVQTVNDPTAS